MPRVELLPEGETRLLDRYQLIGTIASGGMGTVSLARIAGAGGFQRLVAIKQLHPHLAKEREFVEMFLDEARLAAGIHHQSVVSILEIGTSESGYYLVMEYIEGASLARLLSRCRRLGKPFSRSVAFRVLLDALAGLHAAHELTDDDGRCLNLVHRDCSPQNILLGVDGSTKITDFGVARASSRLASTREGSLKGKLAYMAPEQTQGEDVDRRADLFAIAVILWEILAQRRLFKAGSDAETLNRLLHDPIPRLADVVPDVHPALDALCAKALQREPDKRFQTAEEMADALAHVARASTDRSDEFSIALVPSVGTLVTSVLGDDLVSQRDSVRSWLSKTDSISVVSQVGALASRASETGWQPLGAESGPGTAPTRPGEVGDESTLPRTVRSLGAETDGRKRSTHWLIACFSVALLVAGVWLALSRGNGADTSPAAAAQPLPSVADTGAVPASAKPSEGAERPPDPSNGAAGGEPEPSSAPVAPPLTAVSTPGGGPAPWSPPRPPEGPAPASPPSAEPTGTRSAEGTPASNPYR